MARTVEGIFRSQAQAERALLELKARNLDRDVVLQPRLPSGRGQNLGPRSMEVSAELGEQRLSEDWILPPYKMSVTTSGRKAPETAQVLRQFGAEEVDLQ